MANTRKQNEKYENLKDFTSEQDREEAAKNGRKGGKRSGEVRRFKAILAKFGEYDAPPAVIATLIQNGMLDKGQACTFDEALLLAQYAKAFGGNTKAARFIADAKGEVMHSERVDIATDAGDKFAEVLDAWQAKRGDNK